MNDLCDLLTTLEGCCNWCGKELRGRRTRWCSRACNREYTANHRWTQAKAAAKKEAAYYMCANAVATNCGGFIGPDDDCLVFTQQPDVDHIEPCLGKHGVWGCHHHQENLRILCKPCHKKVTREQHATGAFK